MSNVKIEKLEKYTETTARELGVLMMSLSSRANGEPISQDLLQDIIDSPWHDQLVATNDNGKIIGTATVSVVLGVHAKKIAYLEDFVVDKDTQGMGVGSQLWEAIVDWGKQKSCVRLEFTSSDKRNGAINFYKKRGAELRDTNVFRLNLD